MAGQLNLSTLVKLHTELLSMQPGEERDFRSLGRQQPIRVVCVNGVYRKGAEKFYIHQVHFKNLGKGDSVWRDADATACGLYYLLGS